MYPALGRIDCPALLRKPIYSEQCSSPLYSFYAVDQRRHGRVSSVSSLT